MRVKNIVEEIEERNRINKLKNEESNMKREKKTEKNKKMMEGRDSDRDQSYATINDRKSDSEGRDYSGVKKVR